MKPILFHPDAEQELNLVNDYYESRLIRANEFECIFGTVIVIKNKVGIIHHVQSLN